MKFFGRSSPFCWRQRCFLIGRLRKILVTLLVILSEAFEPERLHEVLYPENLFNRVTYTYGKAGDKYNRAGRLALVDLTF